MHKAIYIGGEEALGVYAYQAVVIKNEAKKN